MLVNTEILETQECLVCGGNDNLLELTHYVKRTNRTTIHHLWQCEDCEAARAEQREKENELRNSQPSYQSNCNLHELLYDIQDGRCLYCGAQLIDKVMHTDHIIAYSLAGKYPLIINVPSNYALACPSCNVSKNDSWYEAWIDRKFKSDAPEVLARVQQHIAIIRKETGEDKWRESLGITD